jgi:hypothetical protein
MESGGIRQAERIGGEPPRRPVPQEEEGIRDEVAGHWSRRDSRLTPAFPFSRIGHRIALRRDSRGPDIPVSNKNGPERVCQLDTRA